MNPSFRQRRYHDHWVHYIAIKLSKAIQWTLPFGSAAIMIDGFIIPQSNSPRRFNEPFLSATPQSWSMGSLYHDCGALRRSGRPYFPQWPPQIAGSAVAEPHGAAVSADGRMLYFLNSLYWFYSILGRKTAWMTVQRRICCNFRFIIVILQPF